MTNLRQAAQQALEALEPEWWETGIDVENKQSKAAQALRAALAEPEQEPVAWRYRGNLHEFDPSDWAEGPVTPLYTAPTPRKPLHDMAVFDLADEHLYEGGKNYGVLAFARAIEAAHGIGEQT